MRRLAETERVAAEPSPNGRNLMCGHCREALAPIIEPGKAGYAEVCRVHGFGTIEAHHVIVNLAGYQPDERGVRRLTERACRNWADGRTPWPRRRYTERGLAGTDGFDVAILGHPRSGYYELACPNRRCGAINTIGESAVLPPVVGGQGRA
jgi:hypothetical protein